MQTQVDWPIPRSVRLQATSWVKVPLREITPIGPWLKSAAGETPTLHLPGLMTPTVLGPMTLMAAFSARQRTFKASWKGTCSVIITSKGIWLSIVSAAAFFLAGSVAAQDVRIRPLRPIYIDSLGAAIRAPEGVAYDGTSRLVVADTGNRRFLLYDISEESFSPAAEFRLSQVPHPVRVRFDSGGGMLALDGKSHQIARIAPEEELQEMPEEADFRGVGGQRVGPTEHEAAIKTG